MNSDWTQEWNEEQQKFIDKLRAMENAFTEIFNKDKDGLVIGYEERKELESLRNKNRKILDKLVKKEFTVAVVGLEKAGKSTLGNALIKNNLLPEYTERCTYTTTEIRAGSEDFAEVSFYSYAKFQEKFRKMLEALGYSDEMDFRGLNRTTFDRFWNAMEDKEPEKFQVHNGTTAEDIRAMLDGKEIIQSLLGQPPRKFTADEADDLRLYITGIGRRHQEGFVERTAHPYAVENVLIQSTELHGMEHVVLYDVPGFDSPTQLHKKQTEDMLKEADGIILVTNATEPSLKGTQLDMLRKNRDEDDVKLSAKVFVFGNKVDMARSKQIALDNEATLRNEAVNKHMIAVDGRIVVGSAKAYLEENNILSEDDRERGAAQVQDRLKEWGLSNGIDSLKQKMKDYYARDRYEILKQRAEKTLERAENYLKEILEKYGSDSKETSGAAEHKLVWEAIRDLKEFLNEANLILRQHAKQIREDRPFSRLIEDNIEEIFPLTEAYRQEIESIKLRGNTYDEQIENLPRVDSLIREELKNLFRRNIVEFTARRTLEEQQKIRQELIEAMLKSIGLPEGSPYKDDLIQSANKLFDDLLVSDGDKCRFNSLVERFISSLIEAVITWPFASKQRYKYVIKYAAEFISLAAYYGQDSSDNISDGTAMQRQIFSQILSHEGINENDNSNNNENTSSLQKFFQDNKEIIGIGGDIILTFLPIGKWGKMLLKAGLGTSDIISKWNRMLHDSGFQQKWSSFDNDRKRQYFEDMLTKFCDKNKKNTNSQSVILPDENISLADFVQNLESGDGYKLESEEEMLSTLDTDIRILRDITLHAVVQAIGLERAYNNVI